MTDDAGPGHGGDEGTLTISLVRGDALYRAQRAVGLIPADGLGLGRRAVLLARLHFVRVREGPVHQRDLGSEQ